MRKTVAITFPKTYFALKFNILQMKQIQKISGYVVLFFIVLLSVGACNDNKERTEQQDQNEKEQVKQTLIAMWDAIEQEDMERYATFIHPEFTQFGETDPVLRIGKEAEIEGITGWVAVAENIHTEMVEPRVTLRGTMAFITYYWKDHGTTNGTPFATTGKSTRIFVKENGQWLCIHGHYTLLPSE